MLWYSRRGGVHSVLSSRRSRSVSASPPLEKENPFRRELLGELQDICCSCCAPAHWLETFQRTLAAKLSGVLVRN